MRIYIRSLTDYNEGNLTGKWIDIEGLDSDEIVETIQDYLTERDEATNKLHEEWAIHDYESIPSSFGENPNFEDLVEYVEAVEEYGEAVVSAAYELNIPLDKIEESYQGKFVSEEDFAEQLFDDLYLDEIPEHLRFYIDYKAYARDLFCGDYASECIGGDIYVFNMNY